jgi:hypothetical protein
MLLYVNNKLCMGLLQTFVQPSCVTKTDLLTRSLFCYGLFFIVNISLRSVLFCFYSVSLQAFRLLMN